MHYNFKFCILVNCKPFKTYLLCVINVDLILHLTMFRKNSILYTNFRRKKNILIYLVLFFLFLIKKIAKNK